MRTKLQIALDDVTLESALELLKQIQNEVDIVEVGTPFMMEYGMKAVRTIHSMFPMLPILCDAKIMDAGGYEAKIALNAGAEYVTVLAATDDLTIQDVVKTTHAYGGKVMVDMICIKDMEKRIARMEELGADIIAVHTGVDQQAAGRTPFDDLKRMRNCVKHASIAVAGGINAATLPLYLEHKPEIVIVGGGISHAICPAETAKMIKKIIEEA